MQKRIVATFVAVVVSAALLAPAAADARGRYRRRAAASPAVVHKAPPAWNYMAQRMRPPKSTKWKAKWDNLGMNGWELVGVSENMFIFKRSARWYGATASSAPSAPASSVGTPAAASSTVAPASAPKAVSNGGRFQPPASEGATAAPSSESRFKSRY